MLDSIPREVRSRASLLVVHAAAVTNAEQQSRQLPQAAKHELQVVEARESSASLEVEITTTSSSTPSSLSATLTASQVATSGTSLVAAVAAAAATNALSNSTLAYQSVVDGAPQTYLSTDDHDTIRAVSPVSFSILNWCSVSMSSTGQYQTALGYSMIIPAAHIYTSSDYGVTWLGDTNAPMAKWSSVSVSSTGQYQTACIYQGLVYTSSDFGSSWVATADLGADDWISVSISSTGQYQTACPQYDYVYVSSDYGITWTHYANIPTLSWYFVSLSSTGQYQTVVASDGGDTTIFTSSDYGFNWSYPMVSPLPTACSSVSLSSSGQYQTVTACNRMYISKDYGQSWSVANASAPPNACWRTVSVSASGQYQTAAAILTSSPHVTIGRIYTSSDWGVSWNATTAPAPTGLSSWNSIFMSSNGQFQTAVSASDDQGGMMIISYDFGATWSPRNVTVPSIPSSADSGNTLYYGYVTSLLLPWYL